MPLSRSEGRRAAAERNISQNARTADPRVPPVVEWNACLRSLFNRHAPPFLIHGELHKVEAPLALRTSRLQRKVGAGTDRGRPVNAWPWRRRASLVRTPTTSC